MIDNVHGDNDKTPPPSASQHVMLHTTYSTRALPRNFGKMIFFKKFEKKVSRSWLNKQATHTPNSWGPWGTVWGLVI